MAKIQIDLTGKAGLTNDYYGDMDQTASLNNRNFLTVQGEMVDGFFNPFMRRGFLSPSVSTISAMTFASGTMNNILSSAIYDQVNSVPYFAERGPQIFSATSGLDDTSFDLALNIPINGSPKITDLEIYMVNGVRKLFFPFQKTTNGYWAYTALPATLGSNAFTANASNENLTLSAGSWLANNMPVIATTSGTLPAPLVANTIYWTVNGGGGGTVTQLATTYGGSTIDITNTGSGTHTLSQMPYLVLDSSSVPVAIGAANENQQILADNGFLYLLDGYAVHKFDGTVSGGTNGTFSGNVLLFPPFFNLTDGADYRGNLYLVVHQTTIDPTAVTVTNFSTPCGIYIWDRQTTVANTQDYIPLEGVKSIKKIYIAPNGSLRIITIGANRLTQVRQYNGSTFDIIRELGIGAAPTYRDGLVNAGNITIWLANDGAIYGYGPVDPTTTYAYATVASAKSEALAKIGQAKAYSSGDPAATVVTGALLFGAANNYSAGTGYRSDPLGLTFAYNDGSLKVGKSFPFNKGTLIAAQQSLAGNVFTPVVPLPYASTVHAINLIHATGTATGSTTAATLSIYFNGSSTAWANKVITRDDVSRGFMRIYIGKPWVQSIQFKITYPTSVTLDDSYDYHPMYAEVLFDPMPLLDKGQT